MPQISNPKHDIADFSAQKITFLLFTNGAKFYFDNPLKCKFSMTPKMTLIITNSQI